VSHWEPSRKAGSFSLQRRRTDHGTTDEERDGDLSTRLRIKIWHRKQRYAIRRHRSLDRMYRAGVAVVGTLLIMAGLVMIPLPIPGPGWGSFFLGLGVLSTEFEWAHRVTSFIIKYLRRAGTVATHAWQRIDAAVHRRVERITGARLVQTWLEHQRSLQVPYAFA
jgi:uncharacterized protein (TIGR02611 family)